MAWHVAPSLVRLRREINIKWPNRDKRSDGSIGDASHSARYSDHNPNGHGSVNALDIDKDGINARWLVDQLKKHPSVNYIIFNRVIYSRRYGFRARRYTGTNAHTHHIHVSILQTRSAENSTRPWLGTTPAPQPKPRPAPKYALPAWPFGYNHTKYFAPYLNSTPPKYQTIANVQRKLESIGYEVGAIDGRYGAKTRAAVLSFQRRNGLKADALIGFKTYSKLRAK